MERYRRAANEMIALQLQLKLEKGVRHGDGWIWRIPGGDWRRGFGQEFMMTSYFVVLLLRLQIILGG